MKKGVITSAAFALCLALSVCAGFLPEDRTFSDNENRVLQQRPEITAENVSSGRFQNEIEKYLSDQFFCRDGITSGVSVINKTLGRRDIGSAYIGKDGYYLDMNTDESFDFDGLKKNIGCVNTVCAKNPEVKTTVLLVPCAACVLSDKLPAFASCYDAKEVYSVAADALDTASLPDVYSALDVPGREKYYYKTDHHWTAFGALAVYNCFSAEQFGGTAEFFCGGFLGSTYSKTLIPTDEPDDIYIFSLPDTVKAQADGKDIPVYDGAACDRKDKYTVYLGGNHGIVTLSGGVKNGRTVLVVKDSFANCYAPLLTSSFETVVMVDPRYFTGSLQGVINRYSPDEMLYLFEMSSFAGTSDLVKILL